MGFRTWTIIEPGRAAIYRVAAGGVINSIGSGATNVAFGFFLYDRTGSAVWLSIWFFFSFGVTGILTPVTGWLADRFDRRMLIILSGVAAAACSLALIFAHDPVVLVAIAFVASIVGRGGSPAFRAAVPNVAGDEPLEWANGTLNVAYHIGNLLGPIIGGAVYVAAGRSVVFAFDAVTYLVASLTVWTLQMSFRARDEDDERSERERKGLLRGFQVVFADPVLRALVFIWMLGYFAVDIVLVAELPLARAFGAGALAFGIVEASWGAGSIIGSLLGRRLRPDQDALGITIGVVGIALANALVSISPWFTLFVVLSGLVAVANGIEDVAGYSLIPRRSTDEVRGRVFSTFGTLGLVANAVAFAVAGSIAEAFGPRSVYAVSAVASLACVFFLGPIHRDTRATSQVPPS